MNLLLKLLFILSVWFKVCNGWCKVGELLNDDNGDVTFVGDSFFDILGRLAEEDATAAIIWLAGNNELKYGDPNVLFKVLFRDVVFKSVW